MSRGSRSLALAIVAILATATGCATVPATTAPEASFITIDATPRDAYVYLDGRPLGLVREVTARAFFLPRGTHSVIIVAPGYLPFRQNLVLEDGTPQFVRTVLIPR